MRCKFSRRIRFRFASPAKFRRRAAFFFQAVLRIKLESIRLRLQGSHQSGSKTFWNWKTEKLKNFWYKHCFLTWNFWAEAWKTVRLQSCLQDRLSINSIFSEALRVINDNFLTLSILINEPVNCLRPIGILNYYQPKQIAFCNQLRIFFHGRLRRNLPLQETGFARRGLGLVPLPSFSCTVSAPAFESNSEIQGRFQWFREIQNARLSQTNRNSRTQASLLGEQFSPTGTGWAKQPFTVSYGQLFWLKSSWMIHLAQFGLTNELFALSKQRLHMQIAGRPLRKLEDFRLRIECQRR